MSAKKSTAKKAPAKESLTSKATAAKKAPARESTAKKSTAAKSVPAKKAPVRKSTASKKAPAKKAPVRKSTASKKAPAKKAPVRKSTAAKKAPAKKSLGSKSTAKTSHFPKGRIVTTVHRSDGETLRTTSAVRKEKISVTVPSPLIEEVRDRAPAGEVSAYITEAVARQVERDRLLDLLEEFENKYGEISDEDVETALDLWPTE